MNNKIHLTLLLLTKNEQSRVGDNLKWLDDCPSITEIVVVDDYSTDKTVDLLKKFQTKNRSVRIFKRSLAGDFSSQRQFGLSKASHNWVLWLDADETPSRSLIDFLNTFTPAAGAYQFIRQDIFLGQVLTHTEASHLKTVRLFDKNRGRFSGRVHEVWQCDEPVHNTRFIISHNPHPDLQTFWHKINLYSTIRSRELYDHHHSVNLAEIIAYPTAKFFYNYIIRQGFRQGTPGIIFSLTMSFYSFLTRAKLWQLYRH